ncbi:hypothetical protein SCB49_00225 [unidentified eubacterium SCB49]|nr:hypothetical protein SCB49_00225 [unidentified eubacterium SCB49]
MSFGTGIWVVQAMRKHRKELNARKGDPYFEKEVSTETMYGKFEDHKKMSPEQFNAFKVKIAQEETKRLKKLILIFGCIGLVILSGIAYVLFYYNF